MPLVQLLSSDDCMVEEDAGAVNQDGNQLELETDGAGASRKRFFVKWDDVASTLPAGAVVSSARIALEVIDGAETGTFPITVEMIQVTSADWDETTVTWNNQPNGDNITTYSQPGIEGTYRKWIESSIALVATVQAWADGGNEYGIIFQLDDESPGEAQLIQYDDSEGGFFPILEIEYVEGNTIPGVDPGEDLDSYTDETNDRIAALVKGESVEPAHKIVWTIPSGTDNDITGDVQSMGGGFRNHLPFILEAGQTGEAVLTLHNADQKFSPFDRDSILLGQTIKGTSVSIKSGIKMLSGADDLVEQYIGLADYVKRGARSLTAELKLRSKVGLSRDVLLTQAYAADHPVDVIYDIIRNVLELAAADVNINTFFDAKAGLGTDINVTKTYTNEVAADAVAELAQSCRCSIYSDRRGRIAIHFWESPLTATGNEIVLSRSTNVAEIKTRERDDLIINKQIINWASGLANQLVATNSASITANGGVKAGSDLDLDMHTEEVLVQELADEIFNLRAKPPIEAICEVTIETLRLDVGNQVVITEESEGFLLKPFVVVERTLKPEAATGTLRCFAPQA